MNPKRWNEVDKILQSVLERLPAERRAYVDEVCSGNEELRRDVLTLIGSHEQAGSFMASPALEESGDVFADGAKLKQGDSVGRYQITKPIGHGGMGEVYLAEHTTQNREVALKILPKHFLEDPQRVQRFRQEARAVLALNHPNVVTVYDIGEAAGVHYISTEFVEGQTLRARMARESLTITEAVDIGLQVAGALAYAHEKGVVHRDVKPENIMLRPDGYVKVLDFGIAKLTERRAATVTTDLGEAQAPLQVETSPGMVLGTPHYMSPEQARGKKVDERADTWSLGVVLYEMLTGRQPFAGETPSDVISVILQRDPVLLSTVLTNAPAELDRIISKALDKSKDERYQTATDFLADLRRFKRRYEHESETEAESVALQERTRTHILIEETRDESIPAQKIVEAESLPMRQELAAAQTPRTNRKWPLVALIVLLGLTGIVFVVRTLRGSSPTPSPPESRVKDVLPSQPKTLAVLPFKPLVGKARDPYLEMGIADSLITRLSNVRQLVVRPTSAVQKFNQPERDPAAAGRELGVETVLDGSIQRQGDRLRVTVQLVSVKDGAQLWGKTFDEKFTNIFAVQDAISGKVAEALALKLSGEEQSGLAKRYTEKTEAYELYLKGRYFWWKFSPADHQKATQYFNQAIAKDPTYALAYAGLGDTYGASATNSWIAPSEGYPKAMAAVKKALELDETLAEAHCTLGGLTMFYLLDWANAEREYKRAIELKPNYSATYELYSYFLSANGRLSEAIEMAKRGLETDPLSVPLSNDVGQAYYQARRYDEAIKQNQKTNELDPSQNGTYAALGFAYDQKGMYAEAIAAYQKGIEISERTPSFLAVMGHAYAAAGRRDEALKILSELKQISANKYVGPYDLAILYTGLGEKDKAFEQLDKAIEERSGWVIYLNVEPLFDPLRSDPRYKALLKRINLSSAKV